MSNFKQPVSMPCTEEQYRSDLKEGLEKLGYEEQEHFKHKWHNNTLVTNYGEIIGGCVLSVEPSERKTHNNRHFIPDYNPSLFLAIAGMRAGDDVHVGEWMMCLQNANIERESYKIGDFIEVTRVSNSCADERGAFGNKYSRNHFRKATLSELISHFAKQEKIMEHEFKFGDKVLCWDDDMEGKDIMYFVAKAEGVFIVVHCKDSLEDVKTCEGVDFTVYQYCKPFVNIRKITRSEILSKFNCEDFEIVD